MSVVPPIIEGSDTTLAGIVNSSLSAIAQNIGSLIDRPASIKGQAAKLTNQDLISEYINGSYTILHGDLEQDYSGSIYFFFSLEDAVTFSSYLMMIPDEVVRSNRKSPNWTEEDQEAFGEVGNIIFSALDETLRNACTGKINIRLGGVEKCDFPQQKPECLKEDSYVNYPFECQIADFPSSKGYMLIQSPAADAINKSPIGFGFETDEAEEAAIDTEDADDDFEEAPIRGTLSIFSSDITILKALRRSCRRVGLTFDRRSRNEIPNPSAHQDQIVLIEIGRGQEKRYEWCRRLKASGTTQVVLLLHDPTKYGVALGFKAQADLILGWPLKEQMISEKLSLLLERAAKS